MLKFLLNHLLQLSTFKKRRICLFGHGEGLQNIYLSCVVWKWILSFFSLSYQSCFLFYSKTKENVGSVCNDKRHTSYLVLSLIQKGRLSGASQSIKHRLKSGKHTGSVPKAHKATTIKVSSLRFRSVWLWAQSHWLCTVLIANWSLPMLQFSDSTSDWYCYCFNLLLFLFLWIIFSLERTNYYFRNHDFNFHLTTQANYTPNKFILF